MLDLQFLSLVEKLNLFNKWLGIAPYDVSENSVKVNRRFLRAGQLLCSILTVLTCYELCFETWHVSTVDTLFVSVAFKIHFAFLILNSCFFLMNSIDDKFFDVYKSLNVLTRKARPKLDSKVVLWIVCRNFVWCLWILSCIGIRSYVRIFYRLNHFWNCLRTVAFFLNSFYGFLLQHHIVVLFCTYTRLVKAYLEDLNESLVELMKDRKMKNAGKELRWDDNCNRIKLIKEIRKHYEDICDLVDSIRKGFSFYLFLTVVCAFGEFVYIVFYVMVYPVYVGRFTVLTMFNSSVMTMWTVACFINLLIIVFCSEGLVSEAQKVPVLAHRLYNVLLMREEKEELVVFTIELLHRQVYFTAYGFFKIDFTLLHSIFGALATYSVILFQLQYSTFKEPAEENTAVHVNQ